CKPRLRPMPSYTMGWIKFHARLAARVPRIANAFTQTPVISRRAKRMGGISPKRRMPPFANEPFRAWFERRAAVNPGAPPVVFFCDTFNDFLHPEPAKASVEVLQAAGYRVVVPGRRLCCGRPL